MADEQNDDLWYYVSFANEAGFLGGAYVSGGSIEEAEVSIHKLGIHPGGEAMFVGPLPKSLMDENVLDEHRERLLSLDDLEATGGFVRMSDLEGFS